MRCVFDTNILLHYLRRSELARKIDSEINPFSRDNTLILSIVSARNMGKNDLWIAATASVLNAHLLTTDRDFEHLHDQFLGVIRVGE